MDLYARWLDVAAKWGDEVAVVDTAASMTLTFHELLQLADRQPPSEERVKVAAGQGVAFIRETLVAWRDGVPLFPCERDEALALPAIPDGVCHVKRTSGSTGAPRGVWFSAEQLQADVDQIVPTMGLRREWPNVGVISLAHSYGFSNLVLPLLLHGIPLILGANALPGTVERLLEVHGPVTLPAVPAMWRAWLGCEVLRKDKVGLAISAGAPLTASLERAAYERAGVKIHNFYGSTECGGIAYDATHEPREDDGGVGTAMRGVTLSLEKGCLKVSSRAVGWGYADGGNAGVLEEGSFVTSDRAEIDALGVVRLLGREGEMINVAGRKVAPQEIEGLLCQLPMVRHGLVFGVPSRDSERVDDIVAVVNLAREGVLESVIADMRERLPAWQRPRDWWVCEDLRPDARGKLSRASWRGRYLAARADG